MFSEFDRLAMTRALALAERGLETTHPNPRVGCVLAKGDRIIGEGWHERAGEPHAEIMALRSAKESVAGATAYVTLEPCSHHGRTPPCANALIEARIARVVFAVQDPNPRVSGQGADALLRAGITVEAGLMQNEATELNIGFMKRMKEGLPWVRVKLAMSLDGRTALANGASQWITGESARADVQRWRARCSAVMTGVGTVLADDPLLNVRLPGFKGRQPLRVVLDARLRSPAGAKMFASLASGAGAQAAPRTVGTAGAAAVGKAGGIGGQVGAAAAGAVAGGATGVGLANAATRMAAGPGIGGSVLIFAATDGGFSSNAGVGRGPVISDPSTLSDDMAELVNAFETSPTAVSARTDTLTGPVSVKAERRAATPAAAPAKGPNATPAAMVAPDPATTLPSNPGAASPASTASSPPTAAVSPALGAPLPPTAAASPAPGAPPPPTAAVSPALGAPLAPTAAASPAPGAPPPSTAAVSPALGAPSPPRAAAAPAMGGVSPSATAASPAPAGTAPLNSGVGSAPGSISSPAAASSGAAASSPSAAAGASGTYAASPSPPVLAAAGDAAGVSPTSDDATWAGAALSGALPVKREGDAGAGHAASMATPGETAGALSGLPPTPIAASSSATTPASAAPASPTTGVPAGPNAGALANPAAGVPASLTAGVPANPTAGVSAGPSAGALAIPAGVPAGPTAGAPAIPAGVPAGPTAGAPANPAAGVPASPAAGVAADHTAGVPGGRDAGASAITTAGVRVGPSAGVPAGPSAGVPAGPSSSPPARTDAPMKPAANADSPAAFQARKAALAGKGVRIEEVPADEGFLDLFAVLKKLGDMEVNEVLVEAGPTLAGQLLTTFFVDELLLYIAPKLLGPQGRPLVNLPELQSLQDAWGFSLFDAKRFGDDLRLRMRPK